MSAHSASGAIHIAVETEDDGHASFVAVRSRRAVAPGRLFVGRPPQDIPALASQLFSLCGFAHGAAARRAMAAARADAITPQRSFCDRVGLLAESCAESLRSTALGWPGETGPEALAEAAAPLREALTSARLIMASAASGQAHARREALLPAAQALLASARTLGLPEAGASDPAPDSVLGLILAQARADAFLPFETPDGLEPSDDIAIAQAIARGGDSFAAAPFLSDRIVETGFFARDWRGARDEPSQIAARLRARFHATALGLDMLLRTLREGEAADDDRFFATPSAEREGVAAVETARGRLYHWARLDREGKVAGYVLTAPTEWNFHPAGPFAAALLGARIGAGEAARLRIRRLAAAFDPCVAYQVELRERADA